MHYAALFSLLTILSSLSLLRAALTLVTNPTPIVVNQPYSLTFNRVDGDPESYTLQLFLANTTQLSGQPVSKLDFKNGNEYSITVQNGQVIFEVPQAHTFVATPAPPNDPSKTVAITFDVVDKNGKSIPTPQLDGSSTGASNNSGSDSGSSSSSDTTGSDSQSSSGADASDSTSSGDGSQATPTAGNVTPPSETDGTSASTNSTDGSIPSVTVLNTPQPTSGSDEQPTTAAAVSSRKSITGIIAGAVIGSLVLVAILIATALYIRKRSRDRSRPLSFNRDMMVRQPGPGSLLSSTGSSFSNGPNRYTNNPFQGTDEKARLSGDYEAQAM